MKKIVIIILIIIGLGIGGYIFLNSKKRSEVLIPDNYNLTIKNDLSYVDGPNTTYYIYDNKIIVEKINSYPLGFKYSVEREITLFENIDTTGADSLYNLPKLDNGKVLLKEYY